MPHMKEELLSFTRQLDRNRAELTREFDELRKDKERLDWLLSEGGRTDMYVRRFSRGVKHKPWVISTFDGRRDIDDEIKGTR